ncbi:MAG: thioredoxin domain-containing protein [Lachnospiraceae bacterium]
MNMIKRITGVNFEKEVKEYQGVVLVEFVAVWCGKCASMKPIIEELAIEYAQSVKTVEVEIEESALLAAAHEVEVVPTYVLYENGTQVGQITGVVSKETLEQMLQQA